MVPGEFDVSQQGGTLFRGCAPSARPAGVEEADVIVAHHERARPFASATCSSQSTPANHGTGRRDGVRRTPERNARAGGRVRAWRRMQAPPISAADNQGR